MTENEKGKPPLALPFARVVPTGSRVESGRRVLSACILLTPDVKSGATPDGGARASGNPTKSLDLTNWPGALLDHLARSYGSSSGSRGNESGRADDGFVIGIALQPAVQRSGGAATIDFCPGSGESAGRDRIPLEAVAKDLRRVFATDESSREELGELWRETFTRDEGTWAALVEALDRDGEKGFGPGKVMDGGDAPEPAAAEFARLDEAGNVVEENLVEARDAIPVRVDPARELLVEAIYTNDQADLALALEAVRASRVHAALKGPMPAEPDRVEGAGPTVPTDGSIAPIDPERTAGRGRPEAASADPDGNDDPPGPTRSKDEFFAEITERKNAERRLHHTSLAENRKASYRAYGKAKHKLAARSGRCTRQEDLKPERRSAERILSDEVACGKCLDDGFRAHSYTSPAMKIVRDGAESLSDDSAVRRAAERFFAVQSTGVLARLFCVAIDVEIELSENDACTLAAWGDVTEGTAFVYASVRDRNDRPLGLPARRPPPWTLAKLSTSAHAEGDDFAGSPGDFWPVTTDELDFALERPAGCTVLDVVSQIDGVRVAGDYGDESDVNAARIPRFDLTSLDLRSAAEHLAPDEGPASSTAGNRVFHTAGLAVLDRGVQAEKAAMLAKRANLGASKIDRDDSRLDAEDLTIGYRLDVGVPDPANPPATGDKWPVLWRPMHLRQVSYGRKGKEATRAERLADKLAWRIAGRPESARRLAVDAGMVASPEQLVPAGPVGADDEGNSVNLAVAENFVTWEGSPLGIDTLRPVPNRDSNGQSVTLTDSARDVLPFGREISLPSRADRSAHENAPPALRFGWPYRFALRAVYSGGNSVPIESIDRPSEAAAGSELDAERPPTETRRSFPRLTNRDGSSSRAYFRFLRQKVIDKPLVLMPLHEALEAHGEMGHQVNEHAIVRTLVGDLDGDDAGVDERATPGVTYRLILPPSMAMDEVARHGVLDGQSRERPRGAFRSMRYEEGESGASLPAIKVESVRGFNGAWLPLEERVPTHVVIPPVAQQAGRGGARDVGRRRVSYTTPLFMKGRATAKEPTTATYFPDPFAQTLVIAFRHAGTDTRVAGEPITVDIYRSRDRSAERRARTRPDPRDALPVVLKLVASTKAGSRDALKEGGIVATRRHVSLGEDGRVTGRSSAATADAHEISISIPAGIALDADCWFVPSVEALAFKSAIVQSLAVSMIARQKAASPSPAHGMDAPSVDALCLQAIRALSGEVADLSGLTSHEEPKSPERYQLAAPGGLEVPSDSVLLRLAGLLRKHLERHAISDVAAITTLTFSHASDDVRDGIVLRDVLFHRAPLDEHALVERGLCERPGQAIVVDGEPAVLLSGELVIDPYRVSGFDLVLRSESSGAVALDDKARRRDLMAMRSGSWPVIRDGAGGVYVKDTRQLYGFDVSPAGAVTLPTSDDVLVRVRDIPVSLAVDAAGKAHLPFSEFLYDEDARLGKFGRMKVEHSQPIIDCLGRSAALFVRPVPRTRPLLATRDRLVNDRHVPSTPFPSLGLLPMSGVHGRIPSSVRPRQPATRAPVYCFKWFSEPASVSGRPDQPDTRGRRITRKPVIRLQMERSWFSADADEKVGIVLWPPNVLEQSFLSEDGRHNWKTNRVRYRPSLDGSEAPRDMRLMEFVDEDLGIGGQFITRFGADPLKREAYSARNFIDFKAFSPDPFIAGRLGDFDGRWRDELYPLCVVSNALMPVSGIGDGDSVPMAAEDAGTTDVVSAPLALDDSGDASVQFMSVGLLLFEPRFDPESELWYVDLELSDVTAFSEPFLRFGVVRYTAHGRADLRVSQPAVCWAKLLPEREVSIAFDPPRPPSVAARLEVKVEGPNAATSLNLNLKDRDHPDRPQVHLRVMRELTESGGTVLRSAVRVKPTSRFATNEHDGPVRRVEGDRDGYWHALTFKPQNETSGYWEFRGELVFDPDMPLLREEDLVLYLEEVEQYRPATYPDEPVDPAIFESPDTRNFERDYLIETGPRFACRHVLDREVLFDESATPTSGQKPGPTE